uniref:Uncharacterized protein n=1 Tax=Ciona intestinalis TaxID=7719 RepID=H2XT13_CIOIN
MRNTGDISSSMFKNRRHTACDFDGKYNIENSVWRAESWGGGSFDYLMKWK